MTYLINDSINEALWKSITVLTMARLPHRRAKRETETEGAAKTQERKTGGRK
jgi:hypothetical protein